VPSPKLLDKAQDPRLDRYELIGEIASGGMATVFLARLAGVGGFQRFVAIKRLHPHLSNETEFVEMFLDEARLAASIHHPHVVPILEVGTSTAGYYVVMEYIEGDTLAGLLAREAGRGAKVPRKVAMRIALDTLAGLHAAHELRDEDNNLVHLVHRDVSPQNILVGVDGSARITDFGVARASSRLASTRSGTLKGKLAYMPPEQAKGSASIDQRTDVFAMGVVLWECLAGKRLFKGETELETLNRLMFEPIPRVRSAAPDVPEAIEQVIATALERDVDKRFSSAAEFADSLERAAQGGEFSIAAVRETASYVQDLIGQEIQQQRAAVRAWLAAEPSQGLKPTSLSQMAADISVTDDTGVEIVPSERRPAPSSRRPLPAPSSGPLPTPLPPPGVVPPRSSSKPPSQRPSGAAPQSWPAPSQRVPAERPGLAEALPDGNTERPPLDEPLGPPSLTSAGAMALPDPRGASVLPPLAGEPADQPRGRPTLWLAPLALLVLGGAALVGWSLSHPGAEAASLPATPAASAPAALAAPPEAATTAPTVATAAPTATTPTAASAEPGSLSIDSLPTVDAKTSVPSGGALPAGGHAAKKAPDARADPKAAPDKTAATATAAPTPAPTPQPPKGGDDGYKNPYRLSNAGRGRRPEQRV
jgi:eukaryotic-like serine/threonine-protein kinase